MVPGALRFDRLTVQSMKFDCDNLRYDMASVFSFVALRVAFWHAAVLLLVFSRAIGAETAAGEAIDPVVLKERAMQVMETYCVSCHGPDKQKGKVRLDALDTIDPVDLQKLFGTTKEVVHFEDMPPEEEKQPSET